MTTNDTKHSAHQGIRPAPVPQSRAARLLQRIEDAAIFCAFALALSFMATSAVMVVSA